MRYFREAAGNLLPGISLRERSDDDGGFLSDLYASTREEELRPVDWPDARKRTFLHDQFLLQHIHYAKHYPRAEWLIIERDGMRIGRLYLETTRVERRLMDIALLAEQRNCGIGTALLRGLLAEADALRLPVTLHVEPFNLALRLYARLGFVTLETRGVYYFMQRPVPG